MIVSPDALRKDVVALLRSIDDQIDEVEAESRKLGCLPEQVRDTNGSWALSPLLLAKAQAYAALVQLNEQNKRKK